MYRELTTADIIQDLMRIECFGRGAYAWDCCKALAEWLEDREDECGENWKLDPIAMRCSWSHYSIEEAAVNWGIDTSGEEDTDFVKLIVLDYLAEHTEVIHVEDDIYLVQEF